MDLPNTVFKASVLKKLKELKLNVQKSRKIMYRKIRNTNEETKYLKSNQK